MNTGQLPDLGLVAQEVGTPAYVYSSATLERHYGVFQEALSGTDHLICYSIKACGNQAVLSFSLASRNAAGRFDRSVRRR